MQKEISCASTQIRQLTLQPSELITETCPDCELRIVGGRCWFCGWESDYQDKNPATAYPTLQSWRRGWRKRISMILVAVLVPLAVVRLVDRISGFRRASYIPDAGRTGSGR